MSESEYTGPRCGAVLFPVRRRKLSMRPLTSRSLPMEGMLEFTFVSRRGDQKPDSIVTACTGTLRSFAYGDFVRFRTAWSRQAGLVVSATEFCSGTGMPIGALNSRNSFCALGNTEIADADRADDTNFLRENFCLMFICNLPRNIRHNGDMIAQGNANLLPGTSFFGTLRSVLFTYKKTVVTEPHFG